MKITMISICDEVTGSPNITKVDYLYSWFGRNGKFQSELVKARYSISLIWTPQTPG